MATVEKCGITYHCLGCGDLATADHLMLCTAPHDDGEPLRGPLCSACLAAHQITAHDALKAPWLH